MTRNDVRGPETSIYGSDSTTASFRYERAPHDSFLEWYIHGLERGD